MRQIGVGLRLLDVSQPVLAARDGAAAVPVRPVRLPVQPYTQGRIVVTDRSGLEELACECYRCVRDEYNRLLN